jgi:hypothetical protein
MWCTPRTGCIGWIISSTCGVGVATSTGYTSARYFPVSYISNVWVCVATSAGSISMSNVSKMWVCVVTLARYVLCKSAGHVFARISSMRFGYMKIAECWADAFRKYETIAHCCSAGDARISCEVSMPRGTRVFRSTRQYCFFLPFLYSLKINKKTKNPATREVQSVIRFLNAKNVRPAEIHRQTVEV